MSGRSDEFLVLDLRRTHLILLSRILTVDFTWMSFYQVKEASFCSQFATSFHGEMDVELLIIAAAPSMS